MNTPKHPIPAIAALGLATALAHAQSVPASTDAPEAGTNDVIVLDPFSVEAAQDKGYLATTSVTATRIGTPIIDTPFNIQVIGEDFLADTGVINLSDAFRYTSSVVFNAGNEFRPDASTRSRGFPISFFYRNGFRRYYNHNVDSIQRIEVIKGPSALYFGRSEPGGVVNYLTKRPEMRNETEVTVTAGSDSFYKALLDNQGVLIPDKAGYRVVTSYTDAESYINDVTRDIRFLYGAGVYRPFRKLEFNVSAEHVDQKNTGGTANGLVYNREYFQAKESGDSPPAETIAQWRSRVFRNTGVYPALYTAPWQPRGDRFNKNGPGAFQEGRDTSADFDARLLATDNLSLRVAYNYLRSESEETVITNSDPHQSPAAGVPTYTAVNYGFLFSPASSTNAGRPFLNSNAGSINQNERHTVQSDLTYSFEAIGAKHTFVGSWEWSYDEYRQPFFILNEPAYLAAGGSRAGTGSLFVDIANGGNPPNLRSFIAGRSDQISNPFFNGTDRYDIAWSGSYQGSYFDKRLNVLAGLRRSEARSIGVNQNGRRYDIGNFGINARNTPTLGANLRVAPGVVLYSNYSESFSVASGAATPGRNPVYVNTVTGQTTGGETLDPETGTGIEFGVKTDFRDNLLSGSATVFRLEKDDILFTDTIRRDDLLAAGFTPQNPSDTTLRSNSGLQRTEGLELDLVITPNNNFQSVLSYSYLWTREVVKPDPSTVNVANGGTYNPDFDPLVPGNQNDGLDRDRRTLTVPAQTFGLWNRYTFNEGRLDGFTIGLGATYLSSSPIELNRRFGYLNDAYVLFNALLRYEFKLKEVPLTASLNVNNLLDEEYFNGVSVGNRRSWRLALTAKF